MFSFKAKKKSLTSDKEKQMNVDRYYDPAKKSDNKTLIILLLIAIQLVLLFMIYNISNKNTMKTYIIERNGNDYTVLGYANDLSMKKYTPTDQQVMYFIDNFVRKGRMLSSDLVLTKQHYEELGYFMNNKTYSIFEQNLVADGYNEKIQKKQTVDVQIISTLKLTNSSYQVRWKERIFNQTGQLIGDNLFVGIYKFEFAEVKNPESLKYNPLNIIITDISQSLEKQTGNK